MYNWAEVAMVYTQDVERQVCSDFQLTFEVKTIYRCEISIKYTENNQRQPRLDNCVQTAHGPNGGCNEGDTATADESDKKLRNKIILHN